MLKVGLTGGIATGKSTVAAMLIELGAPVVDSDILAREAVAKGSEGLREVRRVFGDKVLDEEQNLDRRAMRELIFQDPGARERLNSIVHPRVAALIDRQVDELERIGRQVVFVDVPLLYEVGWEDLMDAVVLVYVPAEVQLRRLMKRDQVERDQAVNALKAQLPIEQKLKKAQFLVDNQGSLEETREQVVALWARLQSQLCGHRQPGNSEPTRK